MVSERIQRQIDRFLDEAEEAVTQGDWAVAEDRARKVLALDPENSDALTYVAAADRAEHERAGVRNRLTDACADIAARAYVEGAVFPGAAGGAVRTFLTDTAATAAGQQENDRANMF